MRTKVGEMVYLNSEPFYFGFDREKFDLYPFTPRYMAQAAEKRDLDAGPVPLAAYFQMEKHFSPLGDFCIATIKEARSVLFFSRRPIEDLTGATIAITDETSTSVKLLQILLEHKYKVKPDCYTPMGKEQDAFLLIGDTALVQRRGHTGYPYLYDIGEEWYLWTGLPFVPALWIVRRNLNAKASDLLQQELTSSLQKGMNNLRLIAQKRRDLDMTEAEIIQYLQGFHYIAGDEERQSVKHFRELLHHS